MHSGLVLLTLASLILIILMVTCFICFMRSRRNEEEELVEQVQQYNNQMQHQHQQQQQGQTPLRGAQNQKSPSNNQTSDMIQMINDNAKAGYNNSAANQQPPTSQDQLVAEYQVRNAYANAASPYHHSASGPQTPRTEVRNDITQQINSAVIGSSEAEFQNDFIQVFPMYQIAPQPEKNTTPYLT